jgi:hypothetical protein
MGILVKLAQHWMGISVKPNLDVGRTVNISLMALLLLSSIKMLSQQPIMVIFLFQFISCTTHIHAYMYLLLTLVSYV